MLVLSRKLGEKVQIGDDVTLTVVSITGNRVQLGIEAPAAVRIFRGELLKRKSHVGHDPDLRGKPDCWTNPSLRGSEVSGDTLAGV